MAETFGTLKTRIQRDTKRTDSDYSAPAGDAIVSAIRQYDHMPMWFTKYRDTLTLASGDSSVALPSDFKTLSTLRLIDSTGRVYTDKTGFNEATLTALDEWQYISPKPTQRPCEWAIENGTLYVDSTADAAYTLPLVYYRKDTTYPANDGDSSLWLGDDACDLIRFQAMAMFYRDELHNSEMAGEYEIKANEKLSLLIAENNKRNGRVRLRLY